VRAARLPASLVLTTALQVAAATAVLGLILFVAIYAALADHGRRNLTAAIDTDLAGLIDIHAAEGPPGLARRIQDRLDLAPSATERPWYRLTDADGRVLAGNLTVVPPGDAAASPVASLKIGDTRVRVRVTALKGGLALAVGRSEDLQDRALGQVRLVFAVALVVMVLAAFLIGLYGARRLRGRVAHLNDVFSGLTGAALPQGATQGDEVDELEARIHLSAARIEALMAAQRDISDHIAHETRTPLMLLDRDIRIALEQTDDATVTAPLEAASGRIRNLLRLLDALLDIASAEAQRGDLSALGLIDLSAVARSIGDLYAASAEEAGLDLRVDIDDGIMGRADAMQMSRLMVNLLDNAFKYGRGGRFVRLSLQEGPIITVSDDGPGIAADDLEHVLTRYGRAGDATQKGHGLGLALVRAIAARHGLALHVTSVEGSGATFRVAPQDMPREGT